MSGSFDVIFLLYLVKAHLFAPVVRSFQIQLNATRTVCEAAMCNLNGTLCVGLLFTAS